MRKGVSEHNYLRLEKPLLEGRRVSALLLGHHQVSKNILRGNYVDGRVTVHVIFQRDLVVTFVANIPKVICQVPYH
jgi:hypothetical protein